MIGLDDILSLPPDVAYQDVDGEMVVILPHQGTFLVLNETASWLFARFDGRHSLRQLVSELARRHGLPAKRVQDDTRRWLQTLIAGGVRFSKEDGGHFGAHQNENVVPSP